MQVRHPEFDFSGLKPHWAENTEMVQLLNAAGIVPAIIEPYLIKVLRLARKELDPRQYPDLVEDIDVFIKQEAQHYKLHGSFNRVIRENGYPGMAECERSYAADYERFLRKKSLRWNMAYCEGFEAMGSMAAAPMVDGAFFESLGEADQRPLDMWRWHLAEEYEHRTVAFRTYEALYGHQPIRAWLLRCYGLFTAGRHIGANVMKVHRYLTEVDGIPKRTKRERPPMSMGGGRLRTLLGVLSPFYDPARVPPPEHLAEVLAKY